MRRLTALILCLSLMFCLAGSLAEEGTEYASYALLDPDELPPEFGERKLTDKQIAGLANAGPDKLRKQISTLPDYIAWLDTLEGPYWSCVTCDDQWSINLDPDFEYSWLNDNISTGAIVSLAQYCLEDNYPGMGTAMAVVVSSAGHDWLYANTFPMEDGYLVLCPASYSRNILDKTTWGMNIIEPLQTDDLTGIITFCNSFDRIWEPSRNLSQVLLFDSTTNLTLSWKSPFYTPADDSYTTVLYSDALALYPTEPLDFGSYWFPEEIGTVSELEPAAARALSESSLEELAETVKSVPDLMNYMYYAAFGKYDGDISHTLENVTWHFNYSPEVAFRRNEGNCGATAGYVEYLLQGDYDEVGIIGMTYEKGMGGHVINYIRQGETWYVLDFNSWVGSNHSASGLCFCSAPSLEEAARRYAYKNGGVALMYSCQTDFGDAPVGWNGSDTSYIIQNYAWNIQILLENAPCHYEFVEEKEEVIQLIQMRQNAW